jgi:SSS family solute:Na+ symporter
LPGIIALALNPDLTGPDMDKAYPWLIKNLLPTGLAGLVFAAFIAALISSVDSVVNSASTLITKDIYQNYIVKDAPTKHYLLVGRILTAVFVFTAIFIAPVMTKFPGLFVAGATFLSLFQGPTFAITLLGIYWRRTNTKAAFSGLFVGVAISAFLFFQVKTTFLYYSWWSFFGGFIVTVVVSLLTKPDPLEKIEGLVYGLVMQEDEIQDRLQRRMDKGE